MQQPSTVILNCFNVTAQSIAFVATYATEAMLYITMCDKIGRSFEENQLPRS